MKSEVFAFGAKIFLVLCVSHSAFSFYDFNSRPGGDGRSLQQLVSEAMASEAEAIRVHNHTAASFLARLEGEIAAAIFAISSLNEIDHISAHYSDAFNRYGRYRGWNQYLESDLIRAVKDRLSGLSSMYSLFEINSAIYSEAAKYRSRAQVYGLSNDELKTYYQFYNTTIATRMSKLKQLLEAISQRTYTHQGPYVSEINDELARALRNGPYSTSFDQRSRPEQQAILRYALQNGSLFGAFESGDQHNCQAFLARGF